MTRAMNLKVFSEKLGLSQTTVSRALNGYPEVSEATRKRVMEAAQQFGYRPNHAARGLATGRAKVVGVVIRTSSGFPTDPHYMEFLNGLGEAALERGYDIMLSPTSEAEERATYGRLAQSGQVDAVILSSPLTDDPRIEWLTKMRLPFIVHGRAPDQPCDYHSLDIDNQRAFHDAAALLIKLGHRNLGFINGEPRMTFADHREAGVLAALEKAGLPAEAVTVSRSNMTEEEGYATTTRLLARADAPTAILCSSLFSALGAVRAISDQGLSLGKDISLIAHDDVIPYLKPENFRTPLTTTRSPIRAAGRKIMERLGAMLDRSDRGSEPAIQEVWPVDLIVRDSIGPAPEGNQAASMRPARTTGLSAGR